MTAPQPYGLALHTTTRELGLAIGNFVDFGQQRWQTWLLDRQLASHLQAYLQQFLTPQTWGDLGFIAVARGPGGFTGTRIGVVTARILAQQLNLPLFGISTLACLAWAARSQLTPQTDPHWIAVEMPAQRGMLYGGVYQLQSTESSIDNLDSQQNPKITRQLDSTASLTPNWQVKPWTADAVWSPTTWEQQLERLDRPYQRIEAPEHLGSSVIDVLELAYLGWRSGQVSTWDQVTPFYGQHPVKT